MRGINSFFSLAAASAFIAPVFSHPHVSDHGVFARQTPGNAYPVTGVQSDVQPRLEIRTMQADEPEMWSIFLLAMKQFKESSNNVTSYYSIAGIHGVPRKSWNEVEPCSTCKSADGYCTHGSPLFPAWHRAYVALLEQELYANAQSVAASYSGSRGQAMREAASRMRFPFWDWAAVPAPGSSVLPSFITSPQITVEGPSGQETIDNPLYRFDFEDPSDLVYSPFNQWAHTLRHPSSNAADATSDEGDITATFQSQQPNLQDQVYQLLSTCDNYLEFSNDDGGSSSPGCSNSIESIHNNVHGFLGGPQGHTSAGHMTYLPLAAFDPVFFLHHANVDRIFALWQTLHGNSYGASATAVMNTWTIAKGSVQDQNSPLKPFQKDTAGNFFTSMDVRDFESTFHYTYPEFLSGTSSSNIAKAVNALYGPNAHYVSPSLPKQSTTSAAHATTTTKATTKSSKTSSAKATTSAASGNSSSSAVSSGAASSLTTSSADVSSAVSTSAVAASSGGLNLGGFFSSLASDILPSMTIDIPIPSLSIPSGASPTFPSSFTSGNGSIWQYVANIRYPRWELDDTYMIYLFDGQPANDNVAAWMTDKNLVGIVSALAGGGMSMQGFVSSASVPLTRYLQKLVASGALASMNEEDVIPFLKKNLVWEVVSPKGEVINVAGLPGFQVSVYSSTSNYHDSTALPQWGQFVPQACVTEQKPGGATAQNIIKGASQAVGDIVSSIGDLLSGGNSTTDDSSASPAESCSGPWYTEYVTVTMTASTGALPTGYSS